MENTNKLNCKSRVEIMLEYHDAHMKVLLANYINLYTFNKLKDDEVIGQKKVQIPGSNSQTIQKVTVKEEKAKMTQMIQDQTELLISIESMLKDEGVVLPDDVKVPLITNNKA